MAEEYWRARLDGIGRDGARDTSLASLRERAAHATDKPPVATERSVAIEDFMAAKEYSERTRKANAKV